MKKSIDKSGAQKAEGGTQKAALYEVKAWAGKPQYCCLLCTFDTLDEDAMFDHIASHITPPPSAEENLHPALPHFGGGENSKEKADGIFEIDLKENK